MELLPGVYEEVVDDSRDIARALTAGAAPMYPPKAWFEDPKLERPTPMTITADGRIYGHIATFDQDHMGLPPGTRAPKSDSNYAFFRTGIVKTAEGDEVPIGQITLAGGHAPLSASAGEAVQHYDDTKSSAADVAVGHDNIGIWASGSLRPGLGEGEIRALRASAPSGDWRPINGRLELVAICQVNTPGFPVARAMVASGEITALVAAGARHLYELRQEENLFEALGRMETRLSDVESLVASASRLAEVTDSDTGNTTFYSNGDPETTAEEVRQALGLGDDDTIGDDDGPVIEDTRESLVAAMQALTAAKVVRTAAGAKRWGVPIGTVLDGSGKGKAAPQAKAKLGGQKLGGKKLSTSNGPGGKYKGSDFDKQYDDAPDSAYYDKAPAKPKTPAPKNTLKPGAREELKKENAAQSKSSSDLQKRIAERVAERAKNGGHSRAKPDPESFAEKLKAANKKKYESDSKPSGDAFSEAIRRRNAANGKS